MVRSRSSYSLPAVPWRMCLLGIGAAFFANSVGCLGSRRPPAIRPASIDADDVASGALAKYDANDDGAIDSQELDAAPSLRFSAEKIDSNGDRRIDAEEIKAYVELHWVRSNTILPVRCEVAIDGRPLHGATVTFEPEPFMGSRFKPASTMLTRGSGMVDLADEDRPDPNARGVQTGFYLIRVSLVADGKERIPAQFNRDTVLGCEVAARASYMPGPLRLNLSTRG